MTRAYWLCQAVGWGLYVAFTIVQMLGEGSAPGEAVAGPLVAAAIGIAVTHAARRAVARAATRRSGELLARVVASSVVCSGVLVGTLAGLGALVATPPTIDEIGFAVIRWLFVFFAWHALYVGFALLRARDAMARTLVDARLQALESAMNPHFLFNALNTVRALVNSDPARADTAIVQLARLLRYALAAGREELVSVARELESVDDYLAIERLRLDDRLRLERAIDAEATTRRVPAMIVQTLVENAIKHGIARRIDGGTLRIGARVVDGVLAIEVENPCADGDASGERIGLATASERLRLLCGDAARLHVDVTPARALARIEIPA